MDLSKIEIGAKLPGEALIVAVLEMATKNRETMSQENRDRWDSAAYTLLRGWHNWWVGMGWPGEKMP